jgi:cyclomaltodextrinase
MHTPDWVTDAIFYQIFPDRFARSKRVSKEGLNLESWDSPPTIHGFKGGDLSGVVDHLDYLQSLGVTALYLTPVFASASNHRYHTYDYFNIDPLLGGNDALRELVDRAHQQGMHVILDGVFNHASRGFWQFHHTLENGAASPYVDWFYFNPEHLSGSKQWGAYPSPEQYHVIRQEGSLRAIGYQAWWDMPALPKFNTNVPAVREFLFNVAEHWIRFGVDGWRLDVPGEIDDDSFWREFRRHVREVNPDAYIVGEIWGDARRWLQGDQFDACMNYQLAAACLSFFPGRQLDLEQALKAGGYHGQVEPIDAHQFGERINSYLSLYGMDIRRVQLNLLNSHDTSRFLTCARGDVDSLKLALIFIFSFPGAPCLFYGDEIGLQGGQDPECRKPFPWNQSCWNHDLLQFTRQLIDIRKSRQELRWGDYRALYSDDAVYCFERSLETGTIVVALNTAETPRTVEINISASELRCMFGHAEILSSPILKIEIPARTGVVLGN